ncbi:MAG: FAD-binding oxidoreductase [Phycisphaerales bacterium]
MTEHTEGPTLHEVKMHLHPPADPGVGIVVSNEKCTAGRRAAGFVRHVAIDVSNTRLAGNFRAGQSFGVLPPGQDAKGKNHALRLYSIASPTKGEDGQGKVLATTVKRLIDEHNESEKLFLGVASNWLCDLKPGDEVRVTGPSGKRFVLPASPADHDYIFFATGTGIAPFRGMLQDLLDDPGTHRSRIALIMGSPYASDLLYDNHLRELAARHPNLSYITAISREKAEDAPRPLYVQDRLTTHRDSLEAMLKSDRTLIYVCGIAGMELGIFQSMARMLEPASLDPYLRVDPEALNSIATWERRMIHKQVKPTRRIFLEVY